MSALEELIEGGWADHDRDAVGVAKRLEKGLGLVRDAAGAARLARLVVHVVGQELGEWERAARMVGEVAGQPGVSNVGSDGARILGELAVCRFLSGDASGAAEAELRGMAAHSEGSLATLLRVRVMVAEALVTGGRHAEGVAILDGALGLSEAHDGAGAERILAVAANNIGSALVDCNAREPAIDEGMSRAAEAARRYWLRAGDWRNDQRSSYLLALVANARGRHEEAVGHAEAALAVIAKNGEEPVDQAFLMVALARAQKGLGQGEAQAAALAQAIALRPAIREAGLDEWFERELARAR